MTGLVEGFMQILKGEPLSLALCAMNLILLWFLNKQFNAFTKARQEISQTIVAWQKDTQAIMADCVSKEVMEMILKSLERDRETYRAMLPTFAPPASQETKEVKLPETLLEKS
jgi:hypothetical protein